MIEIKIRNVEWNDYGYYTHYDLSIVFKKQRDERTIHLGRVLIVNPEKSKEKLDTRSYRNEKSIERIVTGLNEEYISLGYSKEYYSNIHKYNLEYPGFAEIIKEKLNDIVLNDVIEKYVDYDFFKKSFTRANSFYMIKNVYPRLLEMGNEKKDYYLKFELNYSDFKGVIEFDTKINKFLPSNIYGVIGNNGAGKTKLLGKIIKNLVAKKYEREYDDEYYDINKILLLTMSSFDNHRKIFEVSDEIKYIGIIDYTNNNSLKRNEVLLSEIYDYLRIIRSDKNKYNELKTILDEQVESFDYYLKGFIDNYILDYKINDSEIEDENTRFQFQDSLQKDFEKLSSGQTNLLYTIFSLVSTVEEEMFAVIDEPELYLHPPYIMGYINILNYIFERRNAIALIASHSPIVIQQIPTNCVYQIIYDGIDKSREIKKIDFPCFGENIDIINDRIFNIKQNETGFYKELSKKSIEELKEIYTHDIGIEAKIFIKAKLRKEV